MPEQHPVDPSIRVGAVDPTLGNHEFTIAELSEAERQQVTERMIDPRYDGPTFQASMRLEEGQTLESQCNANYRWLNGREITMQQYVTVLEAAGEACRGGGERRAASSFGRPHPGVGYEWGKTTDVNPLTGETPGRFINYFATTNGSQRLRYLAGFSDVEMDMAQHGIFTERQRGEAWSEEASCRAEQIVERLEATQVGRQILLEHGVTPGNAPLETTYVYDAASGKLVPQSEVVIKPSTTSAEPIALMPEPEWAAGVHSGSHRREAEREQERQRAYGELDEIYRLQPDAWVTEKVVPAQVRGNGRAYRKALADSEITEGILQVEDQYVGTYYVQRLEEHGNVMYRFRHVPANSTEGRTGMRPHAGEPEKWNEFWQTLDEARTDDPFNRWRTMLEARVARAEANPSGQPQEQSRRRVGGSALRSIGFGKRV